MSLIIRPQRWSFKPPLGAQVNWGHPLAFGLRMAVLFNEGGGYTISDIASLNPALVTATGLTWGTGPKGIGMVSAGSGGRVESSNLQHVNPTDLSIFSVQTATNAGVQSIVDSDDAATQRVYQHRLNSGTPEFIRFNTGNAPFFATAGSALSAAQLAGGFTMAATSQGSAMTVYADGVQLVTGTLSGTPRSLNSFNQLFKARFGTQNLVGSIYVAYVWDRGLSASEIQWLHADPWAVVVPQNTRRIFSLFVGSAVRRQPQCFVVT